MPLIPESCHTPTANQLWSSQPGGVSCTLVVFLAELVSSLDTLQDTQYCTRLIEAPPACKRWPQLVTAHLQNVITPVTEGFQLDNSYQCTLISFWYEHLPQQPVKLMTQSNSVCLKNRKASQQPAAHQITRQEPSHQVAFQNPLSRYQSPSLHVQLTTPCAAQIKEPQGNSGCL